MLIPNINKQVLTDIKEGSVPIFDLVFCAYYGSVKCFLSDLLKSDEEAEQLAQEAFVRLWNTKHRIDTDSNTAVVLFEVAYDIFKEWTNDFSELRSDA